VNALQWWAMTTFGISRHDVLVWIALFSHISLVPYLFDCKPRLIKFFSSFRGAYIFFFSLSKGLGNAQSFLGYNVLTKLSFRIVFSSAWRANVHAPSQEGLWCTEDSFSGLSIITKHAILNAKRASIWKYLRGSGNLCSRAGYINFSTLFSAAYN